MAAAVVGCLAALATGVGGEAALREEEAMLPCSGHYALFALMLSVDASILGFHWTVPRHPKFGLVPSRSLCLSLHLLAGTLETVAGCLALATPSRVVRTVAACSAATCCVSLQVPTSAYQLQAVFGQKRLLMPVGVFVSVLHAASALRLLWEPGSRLHLLALMVSLHWYAFSRMIYETLARVWLPQAAQPHIYTFSIASSGLLVSASLLGLVPGTVWLATCVGAFNMLTQRFSLEPALKLAACRPRGMGSLGAAPRPGTAPRSLQQTARLVFDQLDADGSGCVDVKEVAALLATWGLPVEEAEKALDSVDRNHDHLISFDEFVSSPTTRAIYEFAFKVMLHNQAVPDSALTERRVEPLHDVLDTLTKKDL